jgi:hypothetical protein
MGPGLFNLGREGILVNWTTPIQSDAQPPMDWQAEQKIDEEKQQRRATHNDLHGEKPFGQQAYQIQDAVAFLGLSPFLAQTW